MFINKKDLSRKINDFLYIFTIKKSTTYKNKFTNVKDKRKNSLTHSNKL